LIRPAICGVKNRIIRCAFHLESGDKLTNSTIVRRLVDAWLFVALVTSGAAAASTTYVFTGHQYQTANGSYTTSMSITGSFTTTAPLAANLTTSTNITPLIKSWSFSDGVNAYTAANSVQNGDTEVTTDSAGNINGWSMNLVSPLPPWVANVTPINSVIIFSGTSTSTQIATTGGVCEDTTGLCSPLAENINDVANYQGTPDTWATRQAPAVVAVPVPALDPLALVLLAMLVATGGVAVRFNPLGGRRY
jgi:hypothetical protein